MHPRIVHWLIRELLIRELLWADIGLSFEKLHHQYLQMHAGKTPPTVKVPVQNGEGASSER